MKNNIFSILIISCLATLIYSNSLQNSFHFDDYYYITGNLHIRDLSDLAQIGDALSKPSRYVPFLTFALNYYFHRLDVAGYHVLNIFFHILTSLLVLWFVRLLLSSPKLKEGNISKQKNTIALLTALLFAAHPLQTQAITYLCQRFTVMATMF